MRNNILTITDLSKSYEQAGEKIKILDQVNLSIKDNEVVGLIGPSGCGKTSLLNLIAKLDAFEAGVIKINGQELAKISEAQINKQIGFIYQFHHLLPDFTLLENIMLPAQIAGIKAEIFAKKLLQDFDIFNKKDKLPGQVSGGEQQRAAIIRAMINKPALILADEPTGNLDLKNANKIMTQMLEYFKLHKQSAIIVTHNHNYQTMFDRTLTIVDKKIEEIKANTKS